MSCRQCQGEIKGNYGSLCENCWAMAQGRLSQVDTRRAKIESPHVDLQERTVRGVTPLNATRRNMLSENNRWHLQSG